METDNEHNDQKNIPIESIKDAELLLQYISKQGLNIEERIVSTIVKAKHISHSHEWTPEIETKFWQAFNVAAKTVAPVTVISIKAIADPTKERLRFKTFSSLFNVSAARRCAMQYGILTLVIMVVLLIVQIYFSIGANTIKNIDQFNGKLIEMQTQLVSKAQEKGFEGTSESNKLLIQIDDTMEKLNVNLSFLENWFTILPLNRLGIGIDNSPLQRGSKSALDKLKQERSKKLKSTEAAKLLLQQIQLYILPLLYGLLGACAFVLRTISARIKTVTYTPVSKIGYRLRIELGVLAGLAFGWFAKPETTSSFVSLSPFALAFLAGYSVELLFFAMDKFVSAFSGK